MSAGQAAALEGALLFRRIAWRIVDVYSYKCAGRNLRPVLNDLIP